MLVLLLAVRIVLHGLLLSSAGGSRTVSDSYLSATPTISARTGQKLPVRSLVNCREYKQCKRRFKADCLLENACPAHLNVARADSLRHVYVQCKKECTKDSRAVCYSVHPQIGAECEWRYKQDRDFKNKISARSINWDVAKQRGGKTDFAEHKTERDNEFEGKDTERNSHDGGGAGESNDYRLSSGGYVTMDLARSPTNRPTWPDDVDSNDQDYIDKIAIGGEGDTVGSATEKNDAVVTSSRDPYIPTEMHGTKQRGDLCSNDEECANEKCGAEKISFSFYTEVQPRICCPSDYYVYYGSAIGNVCVGNIAHPDEIDDDAPSMTDVTSSLVENVDRVDEEPMVDPVLGLKANAPTASTTAKPSSFPTESPITSAPTTGPVSSSPTVAPSTLEPTFLPSATPTSSVPTLLPSSNHPTSAEPTFLPSSHPTSSEPTFHPSSHPTSAVPSAGLESSTMIQSDGQDTEAHSTTSRSSMGGDGTRGSSSPEPTGRPNSPSDLESSAMIQSGEQDNEAHSTTDTSRVGGTNSLPGTGSQDPFIYIDLPNLVLTITGKSEGHTDSSIDRVVTMMEKLLSTSIKEALKNVENPSDIEAALMLSFRRVVLQRQDESDEGSGTQRRTNEGADARFPKKESLRCAAELHRELIAHSSISIDSLKGGLLEYLHAVTEPGQFASLLSSLVQEDDANGIVSAMDVDIDIADSDNSASLSPQGEERSSIPAIQEASEDGTINDDDTKFWDIFDNNAVRGVAIGTIALVGVGFIAGAYFLIRKPRRRSTRLAHSAPSAEVVGGAPQSDLNPDWFLPPPADSEREGGVVLLRSSTPQQTNSPSGDGDSFEVALGEGPKTERNQLSIARARTVDPITKRNQQSIVRAKAVDRPPPANEIFTSSFTSSAEDSPEELLSRDDVSDVTWQTPVNLHMMNKNGITTNLPETSQNIANDELDKMVYESMNGLPTIAEERSSSQTGSSSQPLDPPADGAKGRMTQILNDLLFMEI